MSLPHEVDSFESQGPGSKLPEVTRSHKPAVSAASLVSSAMAADEMGADQSVAARRQPESARSSQDATSTSTTERLRPGLSSSAKASRAGNRYRSRTEW